jgi:hypothetical protein
MALPPFDPSQYDELQPWWRRYRDVDIRRLILEVQAQRYVLAEMRIAAEAACERAAQVDRQLMPRGEPLPKLRRRLEEEIQRVGRIYATPAVSESEKRRMSFALQWI